MGQCHPLLLLILGLHKGALFPQFYLPNTQNPPTNEYYGDGIEVVEDYIYLGTIIDYELYSILIQMLPIRKVCSVYASVTGQIGQKDIGPLLSFVESI